MAYTLLGVVQSYLNRTDGFYVNSIFETDESQQVALIAEEVFYSLAEEYRNLLTFQKDVNLDAVSDTSKPNYLLIPENIQRIQESKLWYNAAKIGDTTATLSYKKVEYLTPLDFMDLVNQRQVTTDNSNVITVEGYDGTQMAVVNNQFPSYFTSFDGKYIVCDSYHSDYDTTLQASKTKMVATELPIFLQEDDFVIPLPDSMTQLYRDNVEDEARSALREERDPVVAQRARRTRIKMQQDKRVAGGIRAKQSKGRKGVSSGYTRCNYDY
jgi:hypothetical protein